MAANSTPPAHASASVAWREPLHAYRGLRRAGRHPLLLDGMGAHPEARRACIGIDPVLEVRYRGSGVEVRRPGEPLESLDVAPLEHLRRLTEAHRFPVPGTGFTGGFMGYFGYGFARAVEPTLPSATAGSAGADAVLRLFPTAVSWDRRTGRARVHATDLDGDAAAARRRAREAAALVVEEAEEDSGGGAPVVSPRWDASLDQEAFHAAVQGIRRHVAEGDLFQANVATRFSTALRADPADLFQALQEANPSPFMALMELDDHAVVSASPEQLFALRGRRLRSRPIAATRPRGADVAEDARMEEELLHDPKERAEHTMLVDLVRNDVARVSVPGSVRVAESMSVERYRHVMHLVSRVEGRLHPGAGFADVLGALFPGGTVTGAPKHRACLRIHEAEPVPRGPYTGSAGYLSWNHDAHWNILIRTLVLEGGTAHVHAGSGIVADSVPEREWLEAHAKAQALLEAATGLRHGTGNPTRLGEVTRHGSWSPPRPPGTAADARVLLVDNYDSFVHNLADYCRVLGAATHVVRNDGDWRAAARALRATHLILSPGPGRPEDAGCSVEAAREATMPVLGVCLGHQAIAAAHGARVVRGEPVHGKTAPVHHEGKGLLRGLPRPFDATRYHSLVVEPGSLPSTLEATARLEDGTIMALRHRDRPQWGLQFHPESVGTRVGMRVLARFLGASSPRRRPNT